MNTKIFRGLKARKHLKRAQREWSRTIRALHPSNPHRASVSPWRAHHRYVSAQNRAYLAFWAARPELARGDGMPVELATELEAAERVSRRFDDLGFEVTEEHVILEEGVS